MKLKWKVVSPHNGLDEDAPVNSVAGGGVDMNPTGRGRKLKDKDKDQEEDVDVITRQDVKIDGRSKAYRQHRAKLETARAKRLEKKNQSKSKFIENIKSKVKQQEYAVPALSGLGIHATQPKTMALPAMNTKSKKKSKSDDSEE